MYPLDYQDFPREPVHVFACVLKVPLLGSTEDGSILWPSSSVRESRP